jgi:hypothetical protein
MINFEKVKPAIVQFERVHLSKKEYESAVSHLEKNGYKVNGEGHDVFAYYECFFGGLV